MERESLAEELLVHEGYEVVERNWRAVGGEIDRIAWNDHVLCFIEVRARSSLTFGSPLETVKHKKQRKLAQVAEAYLARFPPGQTPPSRFDVVSVVHPRGGPPALTLIKNAFEGFT